VVRKSSPCCCLCSGQIGCESIEFTTEYDFQMTSNNHPIFSETRALEVASMTTSINLSRFGDTSPGRAVQVGLRRSKRRAPQNAVHRLRTACAMRCTAWRGIRGQDTHPCGAGKMACSAGAVQDAVQVTCAPTLTSRGMVVRRFRRVPCSPGRAAPCSRLARAY